MTKSRIGKGLDDIFSPKKTLEEPLEVEQSISQEIVLKEKQGRGRPQEHKEDWTKVTVVLLDKQIHWLDKLALDIRQNTKSAISRAEIIRAVIAAMDESEINFTQSRSEQEIKTLILKLIKKTDCNE